MKLYGSLFVAIAAISYGFPASLMKLASLQGAQIGGLLFFVFFFAIIFLQILSFISSRKQKQQPLTLCKRIVVIGSGTSIALTNTCYFLALTHVPVAIAAVMLMQSVWIAIVLECLLNKRLPSLLQVVIVLLILLGTSLATNLWLVSSQVSVIGLFLGFLAAFCYALTIQFTNKLAPDISPIRKASMMSIGAFIVITLIWWRYIPVGSLWVEIRWGALISIFAMVLPLACLSYGMPRTPPGRGEIISSLELPAAIGIAWLLLSESITAAQLVGVIIIIASVMLSCIHNKHRHGRV